MLKAFQIELLEDLPLSGHDKWYALLAVTGHKKASWAHIYSDPWREGDSPNKIPKERIKLLEDKLDALGLFSQFKFEQTDRAIFQPDETSKKRKRYVQFAHIFIANSQTALEELIKEFTAEKYDARRIGLALDYPETAVEAYASGDGIQAEKITDSDTDKELLERTYFIVSKAHYNDELKVVKSWLDVLKQNSQIIYMELDKYYL